MVVSNTCDIFNRQSRGRGRDLFTLPSSPFRSGNTFCDITERVTRKSLLRYPAFVWNQRLAPLEWAGMAVIIASGIIAMRREKKDEIEEAGFES